MRTVRLDCRSMTGRRQAHAYLAQALELPSWYGRNLDALFDLLCGMGPMEVVLEAPEALEGLGAYGQALRAVFWEAAGSNPGLQIREEA